MRDIEGNILSSLFENEETTFRGIQEQTKISPRILRKYLRDLVIHKLVIENDRENWKRGKKLRYSLSKKGTKHLWRERLNNVVEALNKIHNLAKHLSDPKKLSELRAFLNQPSIFDSEYQALRNGTLTLEEVLKRFEVRSKKTRGLLTESLKTVYSIFLEVSLRPFEERNLVMGITKEGYIYLIPVGLLKKHGLAIGL